MSESMPVGPAIEQLREVIAILRELSNAGPRDQSFKQWRQVTVTLLQRIWPGEQARAAGFRRIAFSTPSLRADPASIRAAFEAGCREAIEFLEAQAVELEFSAKSPPLAMVRPPEAPVRVTKERRSADERPLDPDLTLPEPIAMAEPGPRAAEPAARDSATVAPVAPKPAGPSRRSGGQGGGRPRQRLKDMLGFGDEGTTTQRPAASVPPPSVAAQPPVTAQPTSQAPVVPPPAVPTPPRAAAGPAARRPLIPFPTLPGRGESGAQDDDGFDDEVDAFDFDTEPGADSAGGVEPPPVTLREMLDREPALRPSAPSRAAREVLTMAAMVDRLGVPPQRRAIVRAALIDLGRQLEAPPVQWAAIRQVLSFIMDYPQVARRVIPMLMPYLDEAA